MNKFNQTHLKAKLLILFALLVNSCAASAQVTIDKKEWAQMWGESELDPQLVSKLMSTKTCYLSERNYLACLKGLNKVLDIVNEEASLIPPEYIAQFPHRIKTISKNIGPLFYAEIELTAEEKALQTQLEKIKSTTAINKMLAATYASEPRINFENTFEDVFSQAKDLQEKKAAAANGINEFLNYSYWPHTTIIPATLHNKLVDEKISRKGFGINLAKIKDRVFVSGVVKGSPAETSGIKNGNEIVEIDGKILGEQKPSFYDEILKSQKESVTMKLRDYKGDREIAVPLADFPRPNVDSEIVEHLGEPVGYIRIKSFGPNRTAADFIKHLSDIQRKPLTGIIIDVRDNSGGNLVLATEILASLIGPEKLAFNLVTWKNQYTPYITKTNQVTKLPIVVLVNSQSASASEVLAGVVQDLNRGWVVGQTTFGKGTFSMNGGLKITDHDSKTEFSVSSVHLNLISGIFALPSQTSPHIQGITPDFEVSQMADPTLPQGQPREVDFYNLVNLTSAPLFEYGNKRQLKKTKASEKIEECLKLDMAAKIYHQNFLKNNYVNYSLLKAEEVLSCLPN